MSTNCFPSLAAQEHRYDIQSVCISFRLYLMSNIISLIPYKDISAQERLYDIGSVCNSFTEKLRVNSSKDESALFPENHYSVLSPQYFANSFQGYGLY